MSTTFVLGISGLGGSEAFMRRKYPGLSERTYRLAQGADSAAALVTPDGIIAAAAEERFSRRKGTGQFPSTAIEYVLSEAGVKPRDVSAVAHNFDFGPYRKYFEAQGQMEEYEEVYAPSVVRSMLFDAFDARSWREDLNVVSIPHHVAHGASAFYCSGFTNANVLVADGIGEFESTTLFDAGPNGLEIQAQVKGLHSIGLVYGLVTMHLGFWMNMDEYKVMGLAPYGTRRAFRAALDKLIIEAPDGSYTTPLTYMNSSPKERATYQGSLEYLIEVLGPPREASEPLEQRHRDIAAALQAKTEETIVRFLDAVRKDDRHRSDSLCLAGGVALNCVANQVIRRTGMYRRQFIQPAAGDDGTALGAAIVALRQVDCESSPGWSRLGPPYLGPAYGDDEVANALEISGLDAKKVDREHLVLEVARLLADGNVVALFQGRMEYGPRALGNRSILADPRTVQMRDRINAMVKQREEFRPLAPAVMHEHATTCFDLSEPSDYLWMIETVDVRAEWIERLGAVTHVDGTARVQTVRREDNGLFWELIAAFRDLTGIPVLLNTSFNSRGEPIVCSPRDAINTFQKIEVDAMAIGEFLVQR